MEMAVKEPGGQEEARGVDDFRFRADAGGAVAHQRNTPAAEGDIDRPLQLVRADVDERAAADYRVGRTFSLGHGRQRGGSLPKRGFAEMVDHIGPPLLPAWRMIRYGWND